MAIYAVFAQSADAALPRVEIARHAELHFALSVTFTDTDTGTYLEVRAAEAVATYRVSVRPVKDEDIAAARDAERAGHAAGMSDLAARCRAVWSIEPPADSPEWLTWECCALLAFAALGPVLPPDHSTLLGVRGSRERAVRSRR